MAIKFCTDCGKKVEYKFSPPKFCSDCGTPFNASYANEKPPISRKVKTLNEDETDAESVPHIAKLEYEIEDFGASVQQTMGSLAGQQAPKKRTTTVRDINDL